MGVITHQLNYVDIVSQTGIQRMIFILTDKIFFVADKNGKVYFSKTNSEHESQIKKLKQDGLWYTYE